MPRMDMEDRGIVGRSIAVPARATSPVIPAPITVPAAGIGAIPSVTAPPAVAAVIPAAPMAATPAAGIGSMGDVPAPNVTGLQGIGLSDADIAELSNWKPSDFGAAKPAEYTPSDADLQTMGLSKDQWSQVQSEISKIDLSNLQIGGLGANPERGGNLDKFKTYTAPLSNKGNPTAKTAFVDNKFNVVEGQPIRLIDNKTGKVVFQGTGYDAAEKAIELAQKMTDDLGGKADWDIQTGQFKNPGAGVLEFGNEFKTVAHEKENKSFISEAGDILGDAALGFIVGGPIGAAIAAGASAAGVNVSDIAYPMIAAAALGPLGISATLGATMGAAALGSAVSSVVQGRSIEETLIRSAITAVTAGVLDKTGVGNKISDAVGGVLKDIGFESQVGNIVSGIGGNSAASAAASAAADEIIVTAIVNTAGAGIGGSLASLTAQSITDAAAQLYPGYNPSVETRSLLEKVDTSSPGMDELVITANPVTDAVSGIAPIVPAAVVNQQPPAEPPAAEQPAEQPPAEDDIVVTAQTPPPVTGDFLPDLTSTAQPLETETVAGLSNLPTLSVENGEVAEADKDSKSILDIVKDVAQLTRAATAVATAVAGDGGGGGGGGGGNSGPGLTLNPNVLTPTIPAGGIGAIDGVGGRYPYTPTTYGLAGGDQETEYEFFTRSRANPVPAASTTPAVPAAAPGRKDGGEIQDDMVKHLVEYQKGGGHRGPGKVTGIGSGQEDLIPAWLSDGEYVWSAQDVADLGDGSTDEGVRRLDKMRQMVRQQAGRKDVKKIAKPQKGIDTMLKAVGGQA